MILSSIAVFMVQTHTASSQLVAWSPKNSDLSFLQFSQEMSQWFFSCAANTIVFGQVRLAGFLIQHLIGQLSSWQSTIQVSPGDH